MKLEKFLTLIFMAFLSLGTTFAFAAEMDHSTMDHSQMNHSGHDMHGPAVGQPKSSATGKLKNLSAMPPSGRAREAGSDGRYAMESTSVNSSIEVKCIQATRGIIMLDNATWKRCGGKPKGASMGVDKSAEADHQHMPH
jgi:hypothetical protein